MAGLLVGGLAACDQPIPEYGTPPMEDASRSDGGVDVDMGGAVPLYGISPIDDGSMPDAIVSDAAPDEMVPQPLYGGAPDFGPSEDAEVDMPVVQPPYGIPPEEDMSAPEPDAEVDMPIVQPPYGIPPQEDLGLAPDATPDEGMNVPLYGVPPVPGK